MTIESIEQAEEAIEAISAFLFKRNLVDFDVNDDADHARKWCDKLLASTNVQTLGGCALCQG